VERVDKAILEQLLTSLDAWAILSLPSTSNPLAALDGKCFALSCFLSSILALRLELTLACVVVAHFARIMGNFAWWPLVKLVRLAGGTVPSSTVAPTEGGQPVIEVDPILIGTTDIALSAPSSVLSKRKQDDSVGPSSHKKLKASSCLEVGCRVDACCGSHFKCARCAFGSTDRRGSCY